MSLGDENLTGMYSSGTLASPEPVLFNGQLVPSRWSNWSQGCILNIRLHIVPVHNYTLRLEFGSLVPHLDEHPCFVFHQS